MKELVCKNCGGGSVIDASGMTAVCQYCGTSFVLDHEDTDYYRNFFQQMSAFLALPKDEQIRRKKADELWENAYEKEFVTQEETEITVKYMHKYSCKKAEVYVARRNIIFHFKKENLALTDAFRKNLALIDYPTADTRNLSEHFPKIVGGYVLLDGSGLLVISKDDDEYPLRLFGMLNGRHVAWILSRMENICCVLEYNGLVHPEISLDTLFINPFTHQLSLYGNWWSAVKNNSLSWEENRLLTTRDNLFSIRDVAANLLGAASAKALKYGGNIPDALVEFIKDPPCSDAYSDFGKWDEYLIKSYGERKFVNFETDDEQVYKSKR